MKWMKDRYRDLQAVTGRRSPERDVTEEIESHIAMRIEENVASGMTPEDARTAAFERFGNVHDVREESARLERTVASKRGRSEWVHAIKEDLRRTLRTLRRAPVFTGSAVMVLALGLGAAMAVFTVLHAVVLRPLAFKDADRLVSITHPIPKERAGHPIPLSPIGFLDFQRRNKTFEEIGVYTSTTRLIATVRGKAGRAAVTFASPNLFKVLGVAPVLGRMLTPTDAFVGDRMSGVITYEYWQRRFAGQRDVVGTTIEAEGLSVQILGVLEPAAVIPDVRADIWVALPLDAYAAEMPIGDGPAPAWHSLNAIARLAPGVSLEGARADLRRMMMDWPTAYPSAYSRAFFESTGFTVAVQSLRDRVVGPTADSIWLVFALVALVLLIACTNVANLFIVRADTRRREAAVRRALGANRARLTWHFATESLVISLVAGALAVLLGGFAVRVFVGLAPTDLPRLGDIAVRPADVALTLVVATAVGGVLAFLQAARASGDLSVLREGGRSSTSSRGQHRVRGGLVVGQVALALVLLAAAGVMIQTIARLRDVRPGFDPEHVLATDLVVRVTNYLSSAAMTTLYQRLTRSIESLPNVTDVAIASAPPLTSETGCGRMRYEDATALERRPDDESLRCVYGPVVSPEYFDVLGMRVEGRAPSWEDANARTSGVVITRGLASRLWPGRNPIGMGVLPEEDGTVLRKTAPIPSYYRVVGVVDAMRTNGLSQPPVEAVFFPIMPNEGYSGTRGTGAMTLHVRTRSGDPLALAASLRQAVASIDPMIEISNVRTLDQDIAQSIAFVTFVTFLLGTAAGMGLLLSAVGLFGVVAYVVTQRRGELGIRMALGASERGIVQMITRQAVTLAVIGVAVGVVTAIPVVWTMRSLVYGVSPIDPVTLGAVSLVLIVVAAIAGYIPARRAARIQPVEALR